MNKKPFVDFISKYKDNPVAFCDEVLGVEPDDWQQNLLNDVAKGKRRISVRSAHGVGKSSVASWVLIHTLLTNLNCKLIVTIEEHIRSGGLGSSVLECLNDNNKNYENRVLRIGLQDKFPKQYGNQQTLQDALGLEENKIVKDILLNFKR